MLHIVLLEPEIPENTGNIGRTCVATGSHLHLIRPLGFDIGEKAVRRAGLDYWEHLNLSVYDDLDDFFQKHPQPDFWLASTKAPRDYTEAIFEDGCYLFFGKESKGLPEPLLAKHYERCIRIPMKEGVRSLNLANSVAVLAYEGLRQQRFPDLHSQGSLTSPT
ncbi:MAG: tRNA (cytidine(34)-2'-O)-methyltransferase [Eubacteriales bacterium]